MSAPLLGLLRRMGRRLLLRWRVVSTYLDGERILEDVEFTKRRAERSAEQVRAFRSDQDEGPVVVVERRSGRVV